MSSSIRVKDVRQVFPVRSETDRRIREFVALDHFDLEIAAGEFRTLVGPSGCGKSTVLDLVSGLTPPTSGLVEVAGSTVSGPGLDRGVVFQQYTLLPWRSARANIEFALEAVGGMNRTQRRSAAMEYLELVGLADFAERYPHELSGGMKQRVAIARSLSYRPGVLLMDEPFGALDAQTRESLQEELVRIWQQTATTILFITHDIDEAVFLGQNVTVMAGRPGRVVDTIHVGLDRTGGIDVRTLPEFTRTRYAVSALLRGTTTAHDASALTTEVSAGV